MSIDRHKYEHTTESLYNREWKQKYIVGYGSGIYIGTGPEAIWICKASHEEVATKQLCDLHILICKEHNEAIAIGMVYKKKKSFFLFRFFRWIKIKFTPDFKYNYPADLDKNPDPNKYL